MILGADNRKKWSTLDVLIMQAWEILEAERCSQCGLPKWLCHNDDPLLQVRVKEDKCWVKPEIDEHEKKRADDDDFRGGVAYPEVYSRDEAPLERFRDTYYEALAAEDAEQEDDAD